MFKKRDLKSLNLTSNIGDVKLNLNDILEIKTYAELSKLRNDLHLIMDIGQIVSSYHPVVLEAIRNRRAETPDEEYAFARKNGLKYSLNRSLSARDTLATAHDWWCSESRKESFMGVVYNIIADAQIRSVSNWSLTRKIEVKLLKYINEEECDLRQWFSDSTISNEVKESVIKSAIKSIEDDIAYAQYEIDKLDAEEDTRRAIRGS